MHNMQTSYICTTNLERLWKAHNQNLLNRDNQNQSQYNCAGSSKDSLKGGNCYLENIVNEANVNSGLEMKFYIGLCSNQFGFRYAIKNLLAVAGIKNETKL